MMWNIKYRNNITGKIHHVNYPYIDHRGYVVEPWEAWCKDFLSEVIGDSFYDYLGAELIDYN